MIEILKFLYVAFLGIYNIYSFDQPFTLFIHIPYNFALAYVHLKIQQLYKFLWKAFRLARDFEALCTLLRICSCVLLTRVICLFVLDVLLRCNLLSCLG